MIDLDTNSLKIVKAILKKFAPKARAYVFGSRVLGRAKAFSDLDLALDNGQQMDLETLGKLRDAFSESDLPIRVDIVDYLSISSDFKKIIDTQKITLEF